MSDTRNSQKEKFLQIPSVVHFPNTKSETKNLSLFWNSPLWRKQNPFLYISSRLEYEGNWLFWGKARTEVQVYAVLSWCFHKLCELCFKVQLSEKQRFNLTVHKSSSQMLVFFSLWLQVFTVIVSVLRDSGVQTAPCLVTAKTEHPALQMMGSVSVHQDTEAPLAREVRTT